VCWRCKQPIGAQEGWHLGHDDFGGWAGPEHVRCNTVDGGRKRARQLYGRSADAKPLVGGGWSRHWAGGFDERCAACFAAGEPCTDATKND
jgi:hypothetical protein